MRDNYQVSEEIKMDDTGIFGQQEVNEEQRSLMKSIAIQANILQGMFTHFGYSREMSIALTNLEQAVMWANKAISRIK